jgi:ElaB/YqjD/DUF883 family membrane-anchored ribosome-binding protein
MLQGPLMAMEKTMTTTNTTVARDEVLKEFGAIVEDTEQLLKSIAAAGGEKAQAVRTSVEQNLRSAKERLQELELAAEQRARAAARATDAYVHEKPWASMAIAAGIAAIIGVVIGLLLNRRA